MTKPSCTKSKAFLALKARLAACKKSPKHPNLYKNGNPKQTIRMQNKIYRLVGAENRVNGYRASVSYKKGKPIVKVLKPYVKKEKKAVAKAKVAVKKEKAKVKKEKVAVKKEKAAVKKEKVAVKKEKAVVQKIKKEIKKESNAMDVEKPKRTYTKIKMEEDNVVDLSDGYVNPNPGVVRKRGGPIVYHGEGIRLGPVVVHNGESNQNFRSKTEAILKHELTDAQQKALIKGLPKSTIAAVTKKVAAKPSKAIRKKKG